MKSLKWVLVLGCFLVGAATVGVSATASADAVADCKHECYTPWKACKDQCDRKDFKCRDACNAKNDQCVKKCYK